MDPLYLSEERNHFSERPSRMKHNEDSTPKNKKDNLIFTWGFSKYGQTSHENMNYVLTPSLIDDNREINSLGNSSTLEISPMAGEYHSALLVKNKDECLLYTFGKNAFGQLGIGENSYIYEPMLVNLKEKVRKISLGGEHTIFFSDETNRVYSCGLNIFGQLGTGDFENQKEFVEAKISLDSFEVIKDISAGAQHSIVLTNENRVYYTGFNKNNFMGINEDINVFTFINDNNLYVKKIIDVRTGLNLTGILYENKKSISIFGQLTKLLNNSNEIITLNTTDINPNISQDIDIKDFKFGNEFIVILFSNGEIYTSGINNKFQLGVEMPSKNQNNFNMCFNKVTLSEKISKISVGYDFTIAITSDKSKKLYGWGSNLYGQLCQTNCSYVKTPTLITNPLIEKFQLDKISCGGYHVITLYKGPLDEIPEEEKYFNEYKNKLSSNIDNNQPDMEKAIEILLNTTQITDELENKKNDITQKIQQIKEKEKQLGAVADHSALSRGFENTFEVSLDELEFDEDNAEIGKGTFGDVLRGVWRGEDVAVKFLKGSMIDSADSVKQFIDECNILKNLHHPNILLFMGACTVGPQYFFLTEYCDNGNLFEYLHICQENKVTYDDARRIALEIAYGMNYLHHFRPPILHRDLKSMNVLLDRNTTVKLADFGNTRSFQVQMTKQKGTFQWMAPEVIRGNTYSESSDVFSFGIIMNELVTRVPPYQGTDKKDVAKKVVNNPNYRPPFNPKKVPKDWVDLMVRCWQHNEKDRPTFDEVIDALRTAKLPGNVLIKVPQ